MPGKNLTDRIEKYVKIICKEKQLNEGQVNSIIQLISTVRTDGAISDEDLLTFFELVGEDC
jgi:hypothetical protein